MNRRCMGCMEVYDAQYEVCPFCGYIHGTPPKEAYHITPGSILEGRYIIGRVLGFGGFGITYLGYDQTLQTKVAIKEYMPGEFSTRMPNQQVVTVYSGEREEQFREGMRKIIDEARRLAKFQDEPNIVHIYDCFEANNTAYIVMEYLEGESVKELLAREGRISVDRALDIVLKVISALKRVHKVGIIHRDIAPDNIYILKDGNVKVLDFGAARYATTKHSKSLSVIIKPGYAPEEQYRSRGDQGPWTDVYALAATFYKMVTGVTPEDAMERSVKDLLKKPSRLGASLSKPMETAIMNALNVRIEDRTRSMEEFEQELMAAEVKEKRAHKRKPDPVKIPLAVKILAGIGSVAVLAAAMLVFTLNVAPKLEEYSLPEGKTLVPNLVNLTQEKAVELGEENQVSVIAERMRYSAVIPAGRVTSQSVAGGKQVDVGTQVRIEISRGREKVVVPSVVGKPMEEAKAELEKAELSVEIREVSSDDTAPGSVVSQSIEGNTTAIKGGAITLEIARDDGRGDSSILVTVPELMDMEYEVAKEQLKKDFIYLQPTYDYCDVIPKGLIISADVAAGEQVPQRTNIGVLVSLGRELIAIPDNIEFEMDWEEADVLLNSLGFEVAVEEEYSSSVQKDHVIRLQAEDENGQVQSDLEGWAEKGSTIILTVSLGPKPVQETKPAHNPGTGQRKETQAPAVWQTEAPTQAETAAQAPQPAGDSSVGGDLWDYVPK